MRALRFIVAAAAVAFFSSAHAALVTETFDVTLRGTIVYSKGHVIQITVTYDDAGTSSSFWFDGPNGIAEFGGGDDILGGTGGLPRNYTAISNAEVSISGLMLPAGYTPLDTRPRHYSEYFFYPQKSPGSAHLVVSADNMFLFMSWSPSEIVEFYIYQEYTDPSGLKGRFLTTVPEPDTLALIFLSVVGLVVSRCRKA